MGNSLIPIPPLPPTLKEGKDLIEQFLGFHDEVVFLNSVLPIRFTPCDLLRAVGALPCLYDVLSRQSHDMLLPVHPRNRSMHTRPFPSSRVRSGDKTLWEIINLVNHFKEIDSSYT